MRATTVLVIAAASTFALSACSKKTDEAPAPGAPETPAAATPATPAPTLKRKAGLWEIRISSGETTGTPMVSRFCTNDEVEAQVSVWGAQATNDQCSRSNATRQADGSWTFESSCDMQTGGVTTSKGVVTGDLNSHYQVKATSTTSGASVPQMNRTSEVTIDSSYMGACPADMKPGDMTLPGGRAKMNLLELTRRGK